ncbi:metal-dependent hydrolase [Halosimplex litoreum]|uniref:Metal-dependent hydrolase n=1 Tax=Halosimplex litoreum TaxID=1198301 RepID=A0A7T3KWF5_9EURY|nr:metal-dependent hydrolase [Halosimplex litoreum]QPV64334.1 metal-dependent hydrolase [Halosimplex litoreum]
MEPFVHLALGYLVYSLTSRLWTGRPPSGDSVLVLALATQFPDAVDKPLNWWFGILDGRGIGHSILTMAPLCIALYVLARRSDRGRWSGAFAVGVGTHLCYDARGALGPEAIGESAPYLLWPLVPAPTYPKDSLTDHLDQAVFVARSFARELPAALFSEGVLRILGVVCLTLSLWVYDGRPGLETARSTLREWARKLRRSA